MYQNSRPTNAELNLYKTYYHQQGFFKTTVSKSIQNVKKPQEKPENTMLQKIKSQNLHKIEQMDILRFVNFSTEKGLKISFEKLFGLPTKWEKRYFQVLSIMLNARQGSAPLNKPLVKIPQFLTHYWADVYPERSHRITLLLCNGFFLSINFSMHGIL